MYGSSPELQKRRQLRSRVPSNSSRSWLARDSSEGVATHLTGDPGNLNKAPCYQAIPAPWSTWPSWDRKALGSFTSTLDEGSTWACAVRMPPTHLAQHRNVSLCSYAYVLHVRPRIPISSPWLRASVWNGWAEWKQTHVHLKGECRISRKCFLLPVDLN